MAGVRGRGVIVAPLAAILALLVFSTGSAIPRGEPNDIVPGHYVVVLEEGVSPAAVAAAHNVSVRHTYRTVFNGFVGAVPEGRLQGLQTDPRVRTVERERIQHLLEHEIPTGIDRVEADRVLDLRNHGTSATILLAIAVLDTGGGRA